MPAFSGKSFDALVLQIERKFIVLDDVKRLAKVKVAQLVINFGSNALNLHFLYSDIRCLYDRTSLN